MLNQHQLAQRSAMDLDAARVSLSHVNTLLHLVESAITSGDDTFDTLSIVQIGIEITNTACGRADDEATFFKEVSHV